jgi:hypothetical protein
MKMKSKKKLIDAASTKFARMNMDVFIFETKLEDARVKRNKAWDKLSRLYK